MLDGANRLRVASSFAWSRQVATTPTDAELLEKVKQALGGTLERKAADVTINGRRLASLSIAEVLALHEDLEWRVARAAGTGCTAVVAFCQFVTRGGKRAIADVRLGKLLGHSGAVCPCGTRTLVLDMSCVASGLRMQMVR